MKIGKIFLWQIHWSSRWSTKERSMNSGKESSFGVVFLFLFGVIEKFAKSPLGFFYFYRVSEWKIWHHRLEWLEVLLSKRMARQEHNKPIYRAPQRKQLWQPTGAFLAQRAAQNLLAISRHCLTCTGDRKICYFPGCCPRSGGRNNFLGLMHLGHGGSTCS